MRKIFRNNLNSCLQLFKKYFQNHKNVLYVIFYSKSMIDKFGEIISSPHVTGLAITLHNRCREEAKSIT